MFLFLILLLPLFVSGILILRRTSNITRLELLLPVGTILGLTIFTFFLNILAFVVKGSLDIITAYALTVYLGISLHIFIKSKDDKVTTAQGRELILWIFSILAWGGFTFWKAEHALIGSDTNLYYSIAHSFIRGNFPPLTPWQPDLPLSYHLGTSELLGAFYFLTNLNFQFLHLFFSALFIISAVQIVIWIWGRHKNLLSFVIANLAALVTFISFGFFYLVLPNFTISLPHINNINELVLWLRNLPTVNQAIEVYGAPINLDGLIYFIFHAFGISILLSLVAILIDYRKSNSFLTWIILAIGLSVLAIVDESAFVAAAPAIFVGILLAEKRNFFKKIIPYLLLGILSILIILLQGGTITSVIFPTKNIEKSIILLPQKNELKENFSEYHYYQEISKILPVKPEWGGLMWFHVGVDLLLFINVLILLRMRIDSHQLILTLTLFIAALSSLIAYNSIVPKFLVANGNRFLSFSFLFFSLNICLYLIQIINQVSKNKLFRKIILIGFILWLFIPTIIPPLALLSRTRFGENKINAKPQQSSDAIKWMKKYLPYNSRVVVMDSHAPHPSGMARALVEAGVFAPIFPGEFRAYTIEASPEYLDVAYYLSPKALEVLKINFLLIDSSFYSTLPQIRKKQLENKYFKTIFVKVNTDGSWEKVFRIEDSYFNKPNELPGTLEEMSEKITSGAIYIDNEEHFDPSFLRRAIIFILREKDLYYLPQSGVYLNVEADIHKSPPLDDGKYDYLVLSKNTEPESICKCQTQLIWTGLSGEVYVWKRI